MNDENKTALAPAEPAPVSALELIRDVAMDPNADPQKLQKLLDVQQQWEANEARKAFSAALVDFQSTCPPVYKGREVSGRFNYAGKSDIERHIKPYLGQCGLSVSIYKSRIEDQRLIVEGAIAHRSGHSQDISGEVRIDGKMSCNDTQKIGSASSYAWRYVVCPALGISLTDDADDDGGAAGAGDPITDEQYERLEYLIGETGADREGFKKFYGIELLEMLPQSKYGQAESQLMRKLKRQKEGEA